MLPMCTERRTKAKTLGARSDSSSFRGFVFRQEIGPCRGKLRKRWNVVTFVLYLPCQGIGEEAERKEGAEYQEQEQRGSIIDHLVEARARNQGARSEASVCEIPMPLLHSLRKCKNGTLRMLVSLLGYRKPCPRSSRSASPASLLFHLHTYTGVYTVCVCVCKPI